MKNLPECTADEHLEDCLADPRLTDDQRRMLAVMLRWTRTHITALRAEHADTNRQLAEIQNSLNDHLDEAAPALAMIRKHEATLEKVDTIIRLAFCKSWQVAAAILALWLVVMELAEHLGWRLGVPHP